MKQSNEPDTLDQLSQAYDRILELSKNALDEAKEESGPLVEKIVHQAKEKALEVAEITREQAENVAHYVMRDLHDAAKFVEKQQRELSDWLRVDEMQIENSVLDRFSDMVDRAKLELNHLARTAAKMSEWHTGEITSIGTLKCKNCGQTLHFLRTGHIPPCAKCQGTVFERGHD